MKESASVWQCKEIQGVELLKATFKNFSFQKHWHDELSIGIIERGAEGLDYRGQRIIIPEHHIVAINPGEIHTGFAGCESGWTYRMFYFDTTLIGKLLGDLLPPVVNQVLLDDKYLFNLLFRLHYAMENTSLIITKESLLIAVLQRIFTCHGDRNLQKYRYKSDMNFAKKIEAYLRACWKNNISLQDIVTEFGRDQYSIIRNFQQCFGVTPHRFILIHKILKSKPLLMSGISCSEVALRCGFYDQSHFTRNFKKVMGITPKAYQISA